MSFKHFSHPILSVFQSIGDELAEHFDRKGATTPVDSDDARPHREHPVKQVIQHIAGLHDEGEEVPKDPPSGLIAKVGSFVHEIWDCARLALELLNARHKGDDARLQELQDEFKFSTCDPKWVEAISEYWEFFGPRGKKGEIPYIRYQDISDFVLPVLPKNARIGLFADWGTGTADARRTLEQLKEHNVDILLHLGDIYYSGTPKECKEYFLDIIDDVFKAEDGGPRTVPVYTLTGNHDMYDGGEGYYGLLPLLNPAPTFSPKQAQPASYFCLRSSSDRSSSDRSSTDRSSSDRSSSDRSSSDRSSNDRSSNDSASQPWQLLCMDTGYHDHDPFTVSTNVTFLDPKEEEWHVDKIKEWSAAGGKTLLFSHNQLFTAFDSVGQEKKDKLMINPKLQASYRKFRRAAVQHRNLAAWFWGHEHNLCVYEPYADLARGRCIGHGAVPVSVEHDPYEPTAGFKDLPQLVDDPRKPGEKLKLAITDQVYAHGFVILDLDDDAGTAEVSYYQETEPGTAMYTETVPGSLKEEAGAELRSEAEATPPEPHGLKKVLDWIGSFFGAGK